MFARNLQDSVAYNWNRGRKKFLLMLCVGVGVTVAGLAMQFGESPASEWQLGGVELAYMVISTGLSILAGMLLNKEGGSPLQSDKPTTLAARGSFVSWHVGTRRIGPVFCWAGSRITVKERTGSGKKKGKRYVDYEQGWHVLCIGPVNALHGIYQGGKLIFAGTITSDSHPSGTSFDLGSEGAFTIYWGEPDQPINTFLGDANRVGISSRWPNACYVVWNRKRLSGDRWPVLDYVLERRPVWGLTNLSQSAPWYETNLSLTGPSFDLVNGLDDSDEDVGFLEFLGNVTSSFYPGTYLELSGTGMPDGTYRILRSDTNSVVNFSSGELILDYSLMFTRVYLQGGTTGVVGGTIPANLQPPWPGQGSVQLWEGDASEGANIAHVVGEMLFADFPQGLQFSPSHLIEKWDLSSLEALGEEAESFSWRSAVLSTEGETAEGLLGAMLQDHGVMLPVDTSDGSLFFQRVRFSLDTPPTIVEDLYSESLPEIETRLGHSPVDRIIFSFADHEHQFSDMTISVDDDGQASFEQHQRARKVPIVSTTHFTTAASLAELRAPEELAPGAKFKLTVGREARDLLPGQVISVEGFAEVLRLISVEVDLLSESVKLEVIPDYYGVPLSNFTTNASADDPVVLAPENDLEFFWAELPEQLLDGGFGSQQTGMVPRIRNHALISYSAIHISRDDVVYQHVLDDTNVQTGGTLDTELSADASQFAALGPVFTELGPDNAQAVDYSTDLSSWGLGRQLAVIRSAAGTEICFVQKTTIVSGTQRRLDGLLRARYDTRRLTHNAGAAVYIIDPDNISLVQDGLLEPLQDLFAKSQPGSSGGQVSLAAVASDLTPLIGKGQVPITPDYVHVRAPFRNVPAFQTGDNITISWAISTGPVGTGCGGQTSGVALGSPDIPGTVQIELLTAGDVVQSTISVDPSATIEYEITNAALVAAFTSEPATFKVRVTHIANSYSSTASPSLTITRV
jgi:hypothetical protein